MISDRERFCAVLASGPLMKADAIVVLTGDGEARLPTAVELFRQGGAPGIVVTGGLNNPPHSLPASTLAVKLMGAGVAPDRIVIDNDSMHTQEQAQFLLKLCAEREWKRLLIVATSYHLPRAFLTILKALIDAGKAQEIRLIPAPACAPWWEAPAGLETHRVDLLADEFQKIERYGEHVASFAQGLDYLAFWEGGA